MYDIYFNSNSLLYYPIMSSLCILTNLFDKKDQGQCIHLKKQASMKQANISGLRVWDVKQNISDKHILLHSYTCY